MTLPDCADSSEEPYLDELTCPREKEEDPETGKVKKKKERERTKSTKTILNKNNILNTQTPHITRRKVLYIQIKTQTLFAPLIPQKLPFIGTYLIDHKAI
jgi:hypothetical protein